MSKKTGTRLLYLFIWAYLSIILKPYFVIGSPTQYVEFQQNAISVGLIQTGQYKNIATRLTNLGFTVTLLNPSSGLNDFKNYNIVYLPYGWADPIQGKKSDIEAHASQYKTYVQQGGNLVMDSPNAYKYSPPILPYSLTIDKPISWDDYSEWPPIIVKPDHKITAGLSASGMPGPVNKITYTAAEYEILVKSRKTESPTLVVATYGSGRIVVHSADAFYVADHPISDRVYRRMLNWAAGFDIDDSSLGASVVQTIRLSGNPVSIDIQGNYLFTGKKDSLLIWDISDPINIIPVSATKLFNSLKLLKCYDHYVIIADSAYFALLDVADISNPAFTSKIALYDGFLYSPEGIDIFDETAYIYGRHGSSSGDTKILCVSLANPSALSLFATIKVGSNSSFPYEKCGLYATPAQLFLARDNSFGDNFEIFDKQNILTPKKISGLNLDDLLPRYYESDMNDLAINENMAFVVGEGGTANHIAAGLLAAINITNSTQPQLSGSILVPGNGLDLKLSGKLAFIAHGKGLSIIDISNPTKMWIKDFLKCEYSINRVAVKDNFIYIASWTGGLIVVNTNMADEFPPNIDHGVITVTPPNSQGHTTIIGKTSSVTDWTPPIITTITNANSNQEVSTEVSANGTFNTRIMGNINDRLLIQAKDNRVPHNVSSSVQLPPIPIVNLLPYSNLELGGIAKNIDVIGNTCCFALGENGLAFVDITNPHHPVILSQLSLNGSVEDIKIVGKNVFAACDTGGVQIINFQNISSPTLVTKQNVTGSAKSIDIQANHVIATISNITSSGKIYQDLTVYEFIEQNLIKRGSLTYYTANWYGIKPNPYESAISVEGDYCFICDKAADFVIVNISNPNNPVKVKAINLQANPRKSKLYVNENRAYFLGADVDVFDITNPENPIKITEWKLPGSTHDLFISGNHAVMSETKGVGVLDITTISSPILIDYIGTPGTANKFFLRDSLMYLADGGAGLTILNTQTLAFGVNLPPSPPTLIYPLNGDTIYSLSPNLNWEESIDPNPGDLVSYVLYYSNNTDFLNADSITNIQTNSFQLSNLQDHYKYFWKVKAVDIRGAWAMSNQVFSFFTFAAALPFELILPADADTVKSDSIIFLWHHAFDPDNKLMYRLFYASDTLFSSKITLDSLADTTYTLKTRLSDKTKYFWTVEAFDNYNNITRSSNIFKFYTLFTAVNITDSPLVPKNYVLDQNYPNPFNPQTRISYGLPKPANVSISIFDIQGRLVVKLLDSRKEAGYHVIVWNASACTSGTYFIKMQADNFVKVKKCVLLK